MNDAMNTRLEMIAEMLETARRLVAELECAETVEKEADADAAVENVADFAKDLSKACKAYVKEIASASDES
jgi:predicted transcriptional regulator